MLIGISALTYGQCFGQQAESSVEKIASLPNNLINKIISHQQKLENKLTRQTAKYLTALQKKENKIYQKLAVANPSLSTSLFYGSKKKYHQLDSLNYHNPDSGRSYQPREYLPGMDSLQTAVSFINKNKLAQSQLTSAKLASLNSLSHELNSLQAKINSSADVEQFVRERQAQLENALNGSPLMKEVQVFKSQAFYYQQQVSEYKQMLRDPDKIERKVIAAANSNPAFKAFMGKYSYLAQLFGVPDSYGSNLALDGLQTRSLMNQLVAGSMGSSSSGGSDPNQFMQQQMQTAQQAVSFLKSKLQQLGASTGGGDMVQPNFNPNAQRTKSFLQRIEYGFDVQSQGSSSFQVATINIGLSAGYKFNDKTSAGLGVTYNMGVGHPINQIHLSSQGVGYRSYFNLKIKYNFWFSGGMEYNYVSAFKNLNNLTNIDFWQKSALIGLMKTVRMTTNKQSTIQLLFDALYQSHIPQSSPLVFRMGYKF